MRFAVDENLPDALALWLSEQGHDVAHVRTWLRGGADDGAIWRRAVSEQRIIVTKDHDFPIRRSVADGPQVLVLRVGNRRNEALLGDVEQGWPQAASALDAGQPVVTIVRRR